MNVLCTICGGAGHLSKDCKQKRPGQTLPNAPAQDKAKIDQEVNYYTYLIILWIFSDRIEYISGSEDQSSPSKELTMKRY